MSQGQNHNQTPMFKGPVRSASPTSDQAGNAIDQVRYVYTQAFPGDYSCCSQGWINLAVRLQGMGGMDCFTVENVKAARDWGKFNGLRWGPGTFLAWQKVQAEKEWGKAKQAERKQAQQNPLAQKIAEKMTAPIDADEKARDAAWDKLTPAQQRAIGYQWLDDLGVRHSIMIWPLIKKWWWKNQKGNQQ